jgi:glutamate N-acetyltransferase/amino-acid N-acetyltransferase
MPTPSSRLHLLSPKGFRAAGVRAGLKTKAGALDLGLLVCDTADTSTAAAVFTTNQVFAAPVQVGREHLKKSSNRICAIVVNSGNANACTGAQGIRDARDMCSLAARAINDRLSADEVLPSSTGIIGHMLPMPKLRRGIAEAARKLGSTPRHATQFADAILTTDRKRKSAATQVRVGRQTITIAGVCKGSGMIGPRMAGAAMHATLLAYLTTDAMVSVPLLQNLLQTAVDRSFNAVTVDDHTSTNDTAAILASGASEISIESPRDIEGFSRALNEVCESLAKQIAADGEGATKTVTIRVTGAATNGDAKTIARAIANSPLVKCAMHGNDPNWGRIVSAAGLAGVPFDPQRAVLKLQRATVFRRGQPIRFNPGTVSKSLRAKEVLVDLACGLGDGEGTCWTCDLSKDYVTINADYHT